MIKLKVKSFKRISSVVISASILFSVFLVSPNQTVSAAQTTGIINGGVYKLRSVSSGKNVNVDYGYDSNVTNVYQYTSDGSVEQTFRIVYDSTYDAYRFYSMSSVNGKYRVLDIVKSSGSVVSGCNIEIYKPTDAIAQYFKIVSIGSSKFKIVANSNTNVALTAYGASNGTASGTSSTSTGNVFVSTYTGATNQQWYFDIAPSNNETTYASMYWSYPLPNNKTLSSGYGNRIMNGVRQFHSGIDIPAPSQTSIYSVNNGTVETSGYEPNTTTGRGYFVVIKSNTDKLYGSTKLLRITYMHMYQSTSLSNGSSVSKGVTIVGKIGTTGSSTGNHLHLGVLSNDSTSGSGASSTLNPYFFYPSIPGTQYTINY